MTTGTDHGGLPLLVRGGEAELTLKRIFREFRCYALDLDGSRFAEVAMNVKDGSTVLSLKTANKGKVIAAYELVNERKGKEK